MACTNFTPHGVHSIERENGTGDLILSTPQTTPLPYEVDLSALEHKDGVLFYTPGASYTCTQAAVVNYGVFNTLLGNRMSS